MTAAFHEILFPLDIALRSAGGPQRHTEIVTLGSGLEERNARWTHSRRRYDAGYGVKTFAALSEVVAFFEERRGRLHGFRWRDRLDHSSAAPGVAVSPTDQAIGAGNGVALQGNLDPTVLNSSPAAIEAEAARVLDSFGDGPGHVFNLGHGITPDVPPEHVQVLVEAVHRLGAGRATRG